MKKILLLSFLTFSILISSNSFAQQYWGGGSGILWTSSNWSNSITGPFNQSYISGSAVNFPISGNIGGTSGIAFSSITANEDMTLTAATINTMSTGGTIATITVSASKTLDLSTQPIAVASGTGLIKNGAGTLATSGGTYPNGFTLNNGTVVARGVNTFGVSTTNNLSINGGTIAGDGATSFSSAKFASIIVGGNFILGSTFSPAVSTATLSFASPVSLGALNRTINLNGTGVNTFSGIISSTGGGLTTGTGSTGTLLLSGVNTYSGPTTLSGGTLTLGAASVIPDASAITFNGGILKTGAFSETYSTINISENSTISLVASAQTHTFAASNAISWTTGKTLTITGWIGPNNGAGTAGKIFVGSGVTGLTSTQLSQIKFFNGSVNSDATILSSGEIVPTGTLPIQLATFNGKAINQSILLNWATASETNNDYFDVQRSADGKSFTSIGIVKGTGNSKTSKNYLFTDENPYAGTNYYQLAQHDFDGKTTSSKIISVDSKIDATKLSVYSSTSSLKIAISSPHKTKGILQVFHIAGRKLSESYVEVNKGFNSFDLPLTLINGVHFARYISSNETINQKFIK